MMFPRIESQCVSRMMAIYSQARNREATHKSGESCYPSRCKSYAKRVRYRSEIHTTAAFDFREGHTSIPDANFSNGN